MKKIVFLAITIGFTVFTQAQSEKYVAFMKKNLAILDSAKTPDDLQNAANNFERIAAAEKEQWQPYYFAGYSLVMKCFYSNDLLGIDATSDKADEMIAMAESLSPANSEITALKAMVFSARMRVDNSRGMTMGPKSTALLQQALKQQPANNPRALMLLAQNTYYTPTAFGGGKDPGVEVLKKAVAAFESFVPASTTDPNWGKEYADKLLIDWTK